MDLEGDAATVDHEGEVEEAAAPLLGRGETGDLGDVGVRANSRRRPSSRARRAATLGAALLVGQKSGPLVEPVRHLSGAERARDGHGARVVVACASALATSGTDASVETGAGSSVRRTQDSSQGPSTGSVERLAAARWSSAARVVIAAICAWASATFASTVVRSRSWTVAQRPPSQTEREVGDLVEAAAELLGAR